MDVQIDMSLLCPFLQGENWRVNFDPGGPYLAWRFALLVPTCLLSLMTQI